MSTTFEVYPRNSKLPSVDQVVELSSKYLNEYLARIGVHRYPTVKFVIYNGNEISLQPQLNQEFRWNDNEYGWFSINNVTGGCDVYFDNVTQLEKEIWEEEIAESTARCSEYADIIRDSLKVGHYWRFRRSAGQPGIIALYYGLLAAAVAELTNGFVYSNDGGWDFKYFPILPEEFRSIYFRPENTETDKSWVKRCISSIHRDLQAY